MVFDRSFLPTGARQPQQKLERYAQLYAKYTNVIQLQGNVMRHDIEGMQRAYDQVASEFAMEQHSTNNKTGAPFVLADLNNRTRIAFAASGFVQVLILFVIGDLDKNDREWVFARATQIMSLHPNQPIPTFAPAASGCTLRPDNATTLRVTSRDIARWQSDAGPRFDVVFEDTGFGSEAVNIFDTNSLLTIVENAELITNV